MVSRLHCCRASAGMASSAIFLVAVVIVTLALPHTAEATERFYVLYRQWQPYDQQDLERSASEISRSERGLGWHSRDASSSLAVLYDYQTLGLQAGEPAHNGHLHRLTFGGEGRYRLYRVEARAGLAGTSNMFKYRDFHNDVLNGRIALFRTVNEEAALSIGIGGDHRFGSFRWLPRVRWETAHSSGQWLLDLPVLLRWQGPGRRWQFRFEREGDRWATLDSARQLEGTLYLNEWRAELTYRLNSGGRLWPAVILGIGASLDTRVRYEDVERGTVDPDLGNAALGSIRLEW